MSCGAVPTVRRGVDGRRHGVIMLRKHNLKKVSYEVGATDRGVIVLADHFYATYGVHSK